MVAQRYVVKCFARFEGSGVCWRRFWIALVLVACKHVVKKAVYCSKFELVGIYGRQLYGKCNTSKVLSQYFEALKTLKAVFKSNRFNLFDVCVFVSLNPFNFD